MKVSNIPVNYDNKVQLQKLTLKDLTENKTETKQTNSNNTDSLRTTIKKGKAESLIKFDDTTPINKIENNSNQNKLSVVDKISQSAQKNYENKISYKDVKALDNGNLACAKAVSDILNSVDDLKNPKLKKDTINETECMSLSKKLQTKGFNAVFNPKEAEKLDTSSFKEGDVVFFPRETEQWGLKKMGHVGIISKDKDTGNLVLIHNGWIAEKDENNKFKTDVRVISVSLEKYLDERNVSMILRHKSNP